MSDSVSRRDFLKISSGAAAAVACMPGTLGALGNPKLDGSDQFIPSYCEMCSTRCYIEGRVVDGKNVFIQGNHKVKSTNTAVCARGASGHSQLYDPQRIVTPLIRTGERGENKWREASYEEALDFVAKRMNEIKAEHGAESFIFSSKTGETHHHTYTFANAFGSPNMFSHHSICPITYKVAFPHTFGMGGLSRDYGKTKYVLNFGHNLFEGIVISWTKQLAKLAADPSRKLVVLEPRFSVLSAKADEWHTVRPGTDLAFVLSLIHVWLRDGTYDKEFVEEFAIGLDELRESTKDTTPEWQEKITGIEASVAERIAKELWAAAPKCIIDFGHKTTTTEAEYQRTRAIFAANILMGNIEREGGYYAKKKAKTINKLVGSNIVPTITNPDAHIKQPKLRRVDKAGEPGKNKLISKKHGVLMDIPDAIFNSDPYPVKGWFMTRINPLITAADPEKMKKAMGQLEFIVVKDVYMSECAMMADVVLPEATYLERDEGIIDKSGKNPGYMIRNKIVEPINGTMAGHDVFRALAERMGFGSKYKWKTMNEFRMMQTKGNVELLSTLKQEGFAKFGVPGLYAREPKSVAAFVAKYPTAAAKLDDKGLFGDLLKNLKTPSGKIEIFSQKVEDAFPGWGVPSAVPMEVSNGYPYIITSGKTAIHTNGHTQNIPMLNDLMANNPVWMHPETAAKHDLKTGDLCYLQNETGKQKAEVYVTEGIRPDTLFVYMGFGRNSPELKRTNGVGVSQCHLLSTKTGKVCSTMITNVGCDIIKA